MAEPKFTSYEKRPDNPLVIGTTDTGQKVGFENMEQLTNAGGADKVAVNPNLDTSNYINFSQFKLDVPPVVPSQALTNPITRGDIDSLLKDQDTTYKKTLDTLMPTIEEKNSKARLLALQQDQQERTEKVQERPLDGTVLRSGVAREISNIASGNTRESLVNLREQTFEAQNLANLQDNRKIALEKLKLEMDQGRYNMDMAMKFNDIIRQEKEASKKTFQELEITTPFMLLGRAIYASDGTGFTSEADFQAKTGMTIEQAQAKGLVTTATDAAMRLNERDMVSKLSAKYIDAGIKPTDTLEQATIKITSKSRIYQEEVRPPKNTTDTEDNIKTLQNLTYNQIISAWENEGYINGAGAVYSNDYKNAKREWVRAFGALTPSAGKNFDDLFGSYIDRSSVLWAKDYGVDEN